MTARTLTTYESQALGESLTADCGETPQQWWNRVATAPNINDPEAALASKVARWRPVYVAKLAELGDNYQTRAERESA